jgi:multisubunit Na+/H+ antiporter MnhB subunit
VSALRLLAVPGGIVAVIAIIAFFAADLIRLRNGPKRSIRVWVSLACGAGFASALVMVLRFAFLRA